MYDLSSVDTLEFHRSMLDDRERMDAYYRAILEVVKPGDVVLDIGSGTGILAYFACLAGARHVYAVEQGSVIELARALCRHNGCQDLVTFLNDWSTHIELPEAADVLITETIGNAGFDEGIIGWVNDARKRLLSPDGKIIPYAVDLIAVPMQSKAAYDSVADWSDDLYGYDFGPARRLAANQMVFTYLPPASFLSKPVTLDHVVLNDSTRDGDRAGGASIASVNRDGWVHGLGCWFSAELVPGLILSNRPPDRAPSWGHAFLPLEEPCKVSAGDQLELAIHTSANSAHWHWQVNRIRRSNGEKRVLSSDQHTTLNGQIVVKKPGLKNLSPALNENATIDLFILQQMDGETAVEEISRRLQKRFSSRMADPQLALERVRSVIRHYGLERGSGEVDEETGRQVDKETSRQGNK